MISLKKTFKLEPEIDKLVETEMPYIVHVRFDASVSEMRKWCVAELGSYAVNFLFFDNPRHWCHDGVWALWADEEMFFAFRDAKVAVEFKLRFG